MSLLGNVVRNNKKEAGGGAGGVASANNGLSLDTATGTIAQLGNDAGLATAVLLNDREIPMAGFSFLMHDATNRQFLVDPAGSWLLGDLDFSGGGTSLKIEDGLNQWIFLNATNELIGQDPNTGDRYLHMNHFFGHQYRFGDISGANNGVYFDVNDNLQKVQVNRTAAEAFLFLDIANGLYSMGDISNTLNHSVVTVDDAQKMITGIIEGSARIYADATNNLYGFGDYNSVNNSMYLFIDDANRKISLDAGMGGSQKLLEVDASTGVYRMGDLFGVGNGMQIIINDANRTAQLGDTSLANNGTLFDIDDTAFIAGIKQGGNYYYKLNNSGANSVTRIGDVDSAGNSTVIEIDDNNGISLLCTTNGIYLGGNGYLCQTNALTNGAAAQAGTLTNSPLAGNPTKWIKILDNGTTRHIPAW